MKKKNGCDDCPYAFHYKNADKILVVNEGRIVEEGSHEKLIAKEGKYAAMWKKEHQLSSV